MFCGGMQEQQQMMVGLIHMAKTGGTNLNSRLANKYERVCGNKGWSFDVYQRTVRDKLRKANLTSVRKGGYPVYNRTNMRKWGFENCDLVSEELSHGFWLSHFSNWPLPVQIHLPCRDPVEHLMSQCNHKYKKFTCPPSPAGRDEVRTAVLHCLLERSLERFSVKLTQQFDVKCFDCQRQDDYVAYLDANVLVRRKIPVENTHYHSNIPRNRTAECIWQDASLQQQVRSFMIDEYEYYRFCNRCIGSSDDLLLV